MFIMYLKCFCQICHGPNILCSGKVACAGGLTTAVQDALQVARLALESKNSTNMYPEVDRYVTGVAREPVSDFISCAGLQVLS